MWTDTKQIIVENIFPEEVIAVEICLPNFDNNSDMLDICQCNCIKRY